MYVAQQAREVESRIAQACLRSGRDRAEVKVIAVTKYVDEQVAREVLHAGYHRLGENRWPESAEKRERIGDAAEWHFIGQLQTRKVRGMVDKFAVVHSLDRWTLAEEIQRRAEAAGLRVKCLLQVNVSGEDSKSGVAPDEIIPLARKLRSCPAIELIGLMTMAPHEDDPEQTRPVFSGLRHCLATLNQAAIFDAPLTELSMGMSNDFEIAIEEGATYVRLGSVLVGKDK